MSVHKQVGCSGFRLDLAVVDPRAPGRYLLGVECDGATYHSSATARDRDRLRQEVLEGLGWRICRVWSTDWLRDRAGQVLRVLAALENAQRQAAALQETGPPASAKGGGPPGNPATAPASPHAADLAYASIDEVPDSVLREQVLGTLRAYGATEPGELAQAVARQLGFKRTGRRIQGRIDEAVEGLVRAGQIGTTIDQRLQITPGRRAATP
jgi:very-short-patch-repair endonuclease